MVWATAYCKRDDELCGVLMESTYCKRHNKLRDTSCEKRVSASRFSWLRKRREAHRLYVRVAQLDRASDYGSEGREFESSRAREIKNRQYLKVLSIFCSSLHQTRTSSKVSASLRSAHATRAFRVQRSPKILF